MAYRPLVTYEGRTYELSDDMSIPPGKFIYLRGDASTDGSVRVSSSGAGIFLVEARVSGVWEEIDIHGDVVGPAASTDNALARYDGVTGKLIQNSDAILDDAGNLSLSGNVAITTTDGNDRTVQIAGVGSNNVGKLEWNDSVDGTSRLQIIAGHPTNARIVAQEARAFQITGGGGVGVSYSSTGKNVNVAITNNINTDVVLRVDAVPTQTANLFEAAVNGDIQAFITKDGDLTVEGELSASQGYTGTQTLGADQVLSEGLANNVIIGNNCVVSPNVTQSVIIGQNASAVSGNQADMVIIGYNSYANAAARSVLIGSGIGADRKSTVAVGYDLYGGGEGNVLLGLGGNAGSTSTNHSSLIGTATYIDSNAGIAIGAMANAWYYGGSSKTDAGCIAIGPCSRASGHFTEAGKAGGIALGEGSVAIGEGSIAVGYGSGSFNVDASGFNNQALTLDTVAGLSVGDEIQRDDIAINAVIFAIVGSTIHVVPDSPGEWFETGDTFGAGTYTVQNVSFPQQQYRGPEGANYVTLLGGFSGLPKNADMESAIGIGFGSTIVAENVCQIGNNLTTVTVSDITGFTPGLAVTDGVGSGTVLDTELGFNRVHIHTTSTGNFTVGNTLTDGALVSSQILSVVRYDQGNISTLRVGRGVETITVPNTLGLGGLLLGGQTVDTIETTLTDDDTHVPTSGAVTTELANKQEYCGFENRTDSVLAITLGTFSIAPVTTEYNFWAGGKKYTKTAEITAAITEDRALTYLYFDETGTLQTSLMPWNVLDPIALVAAVYRDGTVYKLWDERHRYDRNRAQHYVDHMTIGARYGSGLTGVFNANGTFSIDSGRIWDEELFYDITGPQTTASVWYRDGLGNMRVVEGSTTAYTLDGSSLLAWDDGSGTLQPIGNNDYANYWVYATTDSEEPIYSLVGQGDYNTVALADAAPFPTIPLTTKEWKLLYRVVYQRTSGGIVFVKAIDNRNNPIPTGTTNAVVTDHSTLAGRDAAGSHPVAAIDASAISETSDTGGVVLASGGLLKTIAQPLTPEALLAGTGIVTVTGEVTSTLSLKDSTFIRTGGSIPGPEGQPSYKLGFNGKWVDDVEPDVNYQARIFLDPVSLTEARYIVEFDSVTRFSIGNEGNIYLTGSLQFGAGQAVDTIETTLTDDDTHIPTSGAVFAGLSGKASVSGTPADNQIAVFTASGSVEGDSNLTWDGATFAVVGTTALNTLSVSQFFDDTVTADAISSQVHGGFYKIGTSLGTNANDYIAFRSNGYLYAEDTLPSFDTLSLTGSVVAVDAVIVTDQLDGDYTLANAVAGRFHVPTAQSGFGAATSTITNAYGIKVNAANDSASTVVNAYGVHIAAPTDGTTVNRSLHVEGESYFAADLLSNSSIWMTNNSPIYYRGDADTDGSVRISSPSASTILIEQRTAGVWAEIELGGGSGDVVGPATSTDNALVRYDGITGKLVQDSTTTLSDTGDLALAGNVSLAGGNYVYLRGNATTDGSVRLSSGAAGAHKFEKRVSGVWVDAAQDGWYVESAAAATTWNINHDLGTSYVLVQVYSGNKLIIPDSIEIIGDNDVTITFATATSGWVIVAAGAGLDSGKFTPHVVEDTTTGLVDATTHYELDVTMAMGNLVALDAAVTPYDDIVIGVSSDGWATTDIGTFRLDIVVKSGQTISFDNIDGSGTLTLTNGTTAALLFDKPYGTAQWYVRQHI